MNLFKKGYSVVACNKITFSAPYQQYAALKASALENNASLRYETTVGAALPILESISRSVNSGDEILRIEAVLSGTLNYIFSNYAGGEDGTFAEVVKRAQDAGYTEPDPRLDLSGRDVLRKLIILSREAGVPLNEFNSAIASAYNVPNNYTKEDVETYVRKSGGKIISRKGCTVYGIGMTSTHIVKSLSGVAETAMTVSSLHDGEYGIKDVCLSSLSLVDRTGVRSIITQKLTDDELRKMYESAEALKEVIKNVTF
jgi:homoserine dehydrogenase